MLIHEFCSCGFPHSEIRGSKGACPSPRLIAACHVLHRLEVPRHPPCALSSLTIKFTHEQQTLSCVTLLDACTVNFALCVFYLTPCSIKHEHEIGQQSLFDCQRPLTVQLQASRKRPKFNIHFQSTKLDCLNAQLRAVNATSRFGAV